MVGRVSREGEWRRSCNRRGSWCLPLTCLAEMAPLAGLECQASVLQNPVACGATSCVAVDPANTTQTTGCQSRLGGRGNRLEL